MIILLSLASVILLVSCATVEPVISDISDSSLKVEQNLGQKDDAVMRKAKEGCALYNKSATRISHTCLDTYCFTKKVLFACR
jgi:hypothetical protein